MSAMIDPTPSPPCRRLWSGSHRNLATRRDDRPPAPGRRRPRGTRAAQRIGVPLTTEGGHLTAVSIPSMVLTAGAAQLALRSTGRRASVSGGIGASCSTHSTGAFPGTAPLPRSRCGSTSHSPVHTQQLPAVASVKRALPDLSEPPEHCKRGRWHKPTFDTLRDWCATTSIRRCEALQ